MNIGFDASRAFIGNRTGTENYSFQILKHLLQIDHTNTYYIYLRPGTPLKGQAFQNPAHNIKLFTIPFHRLWTQAGLAKQTFQDKLDVLFIPAHTIPLIRKPGLKTVVTVHDLGAEYLPKTHQLKQRLYLKMMTRHQLKSATHIIAVSEATKDDLVKKVGIPADKISVVYEGYDKDNFNPPAGGLKFKINQSIKQYNLTYHDYFLFVGTIQPRKNLERLIRAYAKFLEENDGWHGGEISGVDRSEVATPSAASGQAPLTSEDAPEKPKRQDPSFIGQDPEQQPQLALAGSKGWLSDAIYELPKKLGIENHVKFLGYVPDVSLPALYSGARAFLFPSLFEGFGLPILEAMACGCPVLTSNTSSLPEVVDKAAVLVNPYSLEEIAQGIAQLSMNNKLRITLTKLGFKQVKKFSWEKAARETLQILEKVSKTK